ncbi:C2 domain-containing protein [Rutstroemia sp. NJR-2017a WRK4]|nr:C2 domain-containing protein [Rutstroemia sp. NJR-2017a WRK4]
MAPHPETAVQAPNANIDPKEKGRGTIQSNGLLSPEPTPAPEAGRIVADQQRQRQDIEEVVQSIEVSPDHTPSPEVLTSTEVPERTPIPEVLTSTEVSEHTLSPDADRMAAEQERLKQYSIIQNDIQNILGTGTISLERAQQVYIEKAPGYSQNKENLQTLRDVVGRVGVTSGWIETKDREMELIPNEIEDVEMEDVEARGSIEEIFKRITPTMEKILSNDDDDELHKRILDANNEIQKWKEDHPKEADDVDLIDIKKIEDIVVHAYSQAAKLKEDPTNLQAKRKFEDRVDELANLVEASSYPKTWVLKAMGPKPSLSEGNSSELMEIASINAAPTVITKNDPYELNKLFKGKPGYTENGEKIMGHKFNYYKKGERKGDIFSGQLFVAIGPQACPHLKVLPRRSFSKNTVDAYLTCAHAMGAGGRTDKDEFVEIISTAVESCGPNPLKEPIIYVLCKRKEGDPIWTWRTDLQKWVESERAADELIRECMGREKEKRAKFYADYGIKEEPESRDRRENKRARVYGKGANTPSIDDRAFPFVESSVSRARAIKTEAQPVVVGAQPEKVEAQVGFDPTNFVSFTVWYEKTHKVDLAADPAELAKMVSAFSQIQALVK